MSRTSSPWPDDPPAHGPDVEGRVTEPPTDEDRPAGAKGVSITVALASVGFWVALPIIVALGVYSALTVYAIVKAVGSAPDEPNAEVIALAIVGLVTVFVVVIGVAISIVGRLADPKRRR